MNADPIAAGIAARKATMIGGTSLRTAVVAAAMQPITQPMTALQALAALDRPGQRSAAEMTNPYALLFYPDARLFQAKGPLPTKAPVNLQAVDAMRRALRDWNGRGIAATHVGAPDRLAILPLTLHGAPVLVVNPRIVGHGRLKVLEQEGSLSTPGFHWLHARWDWIRLEYEDETRVQHTVKLIDTPARIAQHLIDALEGSPIPPELTRQQRRDAARKAAKAAERGRP